MCRYSLGRYVYFFCYMRIVVYLVCFFHLVFVDTLVHSGLSSYVSYCCSRKRHSEIMVQMAHTEAKFCA
jgi:hypothetical protein